jgi:hypothetical protein
LKVKILENNHKLVNKTNHDTVIITPPFYLILIPKTNGITLYKKIEVLVLKKYSMSNITVSKIQRNEIYNLLT